MNKDYKPLFVVSGGYDSTLMLHMYLDNLKEIPKEPINLIYFKCNIINQYKQKIELQKLKSYLKYAKIKFKGIKFDLRFINIDSGKGFIY